MKNKNSDLTVSNNSNQNLLYNFTKNIFIMKKKYFYEYSEFIFNILFKLEKEIEIPLDSYQRRVFGFLSERMMLPFIEYLKDKKNIKITG